MAIATIANTFPFPSLFFDSLKAMMPKINPMIAVIPQIPRTPKIRETFTGLVFFFVGAPELRFGAACRGVLRGAGGGVATLAGAAGVGGVSEIGGGGGGVYAGGSSSPPSCDPPIGGGGGMVLMIELQPPPA